MTENGTGMRVFNLSNPENPIEVGSFITPTEGVRGLAVHGNYAYVADDRPMEA